MGAFSEKRGVYPKGGHDDGLGFLLFQARNCEIGIAGMVSPIALLIGLEEE